VTPPEIDVRAIAEVLADVLVERGLVVAGSSGAGRVLDATAVAGLLGRERQWVYDHADELGAFRYGDGPRARLGFDLHSIESWKRARREGPTPVAPRGARRTRPTGRGSQVALIPYEGSGRGA
jgi:hypothetical protein